MHFHKFSFKDIIFRLHLGLFYIDYIIIHFTKMYCIIKVFAYFHFMLTDSLTSFEFCCYFHRKTFITVHTASQTETTVTLEIVTGFYIFLSYMYSYKSKLIKAQIQFCMNLQNYVDMKCVRERTLCINFSFHSLVFLF